MEHLDDTELAKAARAIEAGGLVIVPTARWYMICCDAGNAESCARIYEAKQRPLAKSLLLVLPHSFHIGRHFVLGNDAVRVVEHLWPGDLALRLRWSNADLGARYSSVGCDIALVGQPSGVLGRLVNTTSTLIAATSANISGTPESGGNSPAITPNEVNEFVAKSGVDVTVIIDRGICPQFMHMTILDCSAPDGTSRIERDGTTHRRAIELALEP